MHHSDIDRFAALAATMGVWMCGLTRVHNLVWALAVQTGVLGVIAVLVGVEYAAPGYYVLAGAVIAKIGRASCRERG